MSHSPRTAYFDNAKFLLMILVVFSHLLQPFIGDHKFYHDLYYFIFYLSYASLCFFSRLFCQTAHKRFKSSRSGQKVSTSLCVFSTFYTVYYWVIGLDASLNIQLLNPQWALWFLLSMFFWQLSSSFSENDCQKSHLA